MLRLEGEALYAASKSAVETLTRILAREFAEFGITCNLVAPTPVDTDLTRGVPPEKLQRFAREPGAVARFERVPPATSRYQPEEPLGSLRVVFHPRRQLHEHDRGLRSEAGHRPVRAFDAVAFDPQALDVGDKAVQLDGVAEVVGHRAAPLLEGRPLRLPVERIVQLDGVEVLRVVLEPTRCRKVFRIEATAPMPVLPSGCADTQLTQSGTPVRKKITRADTSPAITHPRPT